MKLRRILRMLLPILVIVAVMMSPLAATTAAGMMLIEGGTTMADGMPCCPPEEPSMPDCPPEEPSMPDCSEACLLMTVCFAKCLQSHSTADALIAHSPLAGVAVPACDALVASLAQAPPARPPRT